MKSCMFPLILCLLLLLPCFSEATHGQDSGSQLLEVRVFPADARLLVNGQQIEPVGARGYFRLYRLADAANASLSLVAPGYVSERFTLDNPPVSAILEDVAGGFSIEIKLERNPRESALLLSEILATGRQPKSISFAHDGSMFFAAQLAGRGIDIFDARQPGHLASIELTPQGQGSSGYVEFSSLPGDSRLFVSQMESGRIHVVDLELLTAETSFSSRGGWTKVLAHSRDGRYLFASNWLSSDVSIFSTRDYRYLGRIVTGGVPRGLALSPEGNRLYVADYESGRFLSYDISLLAEIDPDSMDTDGAAALRNTLEDLRPTVLDPGPGAKRHIAVSERQGRIYVSDMMYGSIYVYDLESGERLARVPVGQKLNTIALDPAEDHLYISSRGTNNPDSYLIPGPDFGKVYVLDASSLELVDWVWGGNQPTGLAVSPDGRTLVFSDFLDDRVEVYDISALSAANPLIRLYGQLGRIIRTVRDEIQELSSPVELIFEHAEAGTAGTQQQN